MRCEHACAAFVAAAMIALVAPGPAHATHGAVIVVPGHPGVAFATPYPPGSVVIGEWGLHRPGHMPPQVIGRVWTGLPPERDYIPAPFFPQDGGAAVSGRLEREPPEARRPMRAEPFERSWLTPTPAPLSSAGGPPPLYIYPSIGPRPHHPHYRRPSEGLQGGREGGLLGPWVIPAPWGIR